MYRGIYIVRMPSNTPLNYLAIWFESNRAYQKIL